MIPDDNQYVKLAKLKEIKAESVLFTGNTARLYNKVTFLRLIVEYVGVIINDVNWTFYKEF